MAAQTLNSSMQPTDVYGGGTKLSTPSSLTPNPSQMKSQQSSWTQGTLAYAPASQEKMPQSLS